MTPEEKFNQNIWCILQELKEAQLYNYNGYNPKSDGILLSINIPYPLIKDTAKNIFISSEKKVRILYKLQEWKAIKIINGRQNEFEFTKTGFNLCILQPKFDELYRGYEDNFKREKERKITSVSPHQNTFVWEKLKIFKQKISGATVFDDDFKNFVGIELYDFIQSNDTLKNEFDRRVNYLITLAQDKNFNILQDKLFETIQKILKFISLEDTEQIQKKWKNKLINKLKTRIGENGVEKDFLTLSELYFALQKKDNYYRLIDRSYFSPTEEISIRTHIIPVMKQYEINVKKFFNLVFNSDFFKKNDRKTSAKLYKLSEVCDDYWYKLKELIYLIPIKLHFRNFEQFFLDCLKFYPRRGLEWLFDSDYQADTQQFKKIKENAIVVIDDLSEIFKNEKEFQPLSLTTNFFTTIKTQEKDEEKEIKNKFKDGNQENLQENLIEIKKITIIRGKLNDGKFKFAINDDYKNIKIINNKGKMGKTLIKVIEDKKEISFNKEVFDYFNFNIQCPLYFKGKYQLTKVFEDINGCLKINPVIKSELIAELTYIKRLNKLNAT